MGRRGEIYTKKIERNYIIKVVKLNFKDKGTVKVYKKFYYLNL